MFLSDNPALEDLEYLKISKEPWEIIKKKWMNSFSERKKLLSLSTQTTLQYIELFPVLSQGNDVLTTDLVSILSDFEHFQLRI